MRREIKHFMPSSFLLEIAQVRRSLVPPARFKSAFEVEEVSLAFNEDIEVALGS
jgi:hypothetical protein